MLLGKNKKFFPKVNFLAIFLVAIFVFALLGVDASLAQQPGPSAETAAAISAVSNGEEAITDGNPFAKIFKWLLYILISIFTGLINVAASVFAWATQPEYISGPTGLLNLAVVYNLWKFIRDFFNLAFIFLLLFSAFGTVFQLHQFNLKKNFFQIIGAALLINFSFPITRIIIDMGNVPMYFFAHGIAGDASTAKGNAYADVTLGFFRNSGLSNIISPPEGERATFFSLITGVIFSFMFMITLFALAILFIFRLIKLVILLIFSPLGLAASIIPGLESQGKKWWSSLIETVLFGPAAMLMLIIALRFMTEIQDSEFTNGLANQAAGSASSVERGNGMVAQGIFFIPIILMWMAMQVGNKFGIEGAGMVMKQADKVLNWGKKVAMKGAYYGSGAAALKWGAETGYRKADSALADNKYGRYISPGAWKKALKDRAETKKHQDEAPIEVAAGGHHDLLNKRISQAKNIGATILPWNWVGENARKRREMLNAHHWNTDHTEFENAALVKQASGHAKHIEEVSDNWENNKAHVENALASGDVAELLGHLKVLAKNNDFNEFVPAMGAEFLKALKQVNPADELKDGQYKLLETLKDKDGNITGYKYELQELGKKMEVLTDVVDDGHGGQKESMLVDSDSVKASLVLAMKQVGMNKGQITGYLEHLSNQALAAGNGAYGNMVKREHGNFELTSSTDQANNNAGKLALLDPQKIANGMHADTIFRRDRMGNYVGLNGEVGRRVIEQTFDITLAGQANRMKNTKRGFAAMWDTQNKEFESFYDKLGMEQKYAVARVMHQAGSWKKDYAKYEDFVADGPKTFAEARKSFPIKVKPKESANDNNTQSRPANDH